MSIARGGKRRTKPKDWKRTMLERAMQGIGHDASGNPRNVDLTNDRQGVTMLAGYRAHRPTRHAKGR